MILSRGNTFFPSVFDGITESVQNRIRSLQYETIKNNAIMKKLFVVLIALLPLTALADNDRPVDFKQLPAAAQKFISTHFADSKMTLATVDRELLDTTWDVIFTDGVRIEFDSRGQWKEIECRKTFVPTKILLPRIASFIAEQYPDARVRDIERDRHGFELNLDNGAELYFDRKGNFRGYDD